MTNRSDDRMIRFSRSNRSDINRPLRFLPASLCNKHERHTICSQKESMRGMYGCQGEMHAAGCQPMPAVRSFGQVMHIP